MPVNQGTVGSTISAVSSGTAAGGSASSDGQGTAAGGSARSDRQGVATSCMQSLKYVAQLTCRDHHNISHVSRIIISCRLIVSYSYCIMLT